MPLKAPNCVSLQEHRNIASLLHPPHYQQPISLLQWQFFQYSLFNAYESAVSLMPAIQ